MDTVEYRVIAGRRDADIKAMAALSALDNGNPATLACCVEHFGKELDGLDPAERVLFGAFAGAELLGFCRFQLCPRRGLWWCRGLVVAEDWQRRGIGSTLLTRALAHLAGRGVTDVRSDTAASNTASQAAHRKAGFRLIAAAGEGFDGKHRDGHCFFRWQPGEADEQGRPHTSAEP
ncbi:MAG TPA: GNAT family N-acetyltransferase [Phycisphaerae bacterium]|nr:GNAT family N-acetyltransferase [Phycisphaerae bacterium]